MYTVMYRWGQTEASSVSSESYDDLLKIAKQYGKQPIETIEKWLMSEDKPKLSARFYYVRND